MLYPLKFKSILKDKIWGGKRLKTILNKLEASEKAGESWELSAYNGDISIVSNGPLRGKTLTGLVEENMGDLVGNSVYEKFGKNFPLLIKFIDANDFLSLQVHPDDKFASIHHGLNGKTEMWYIIDAEKDAKLITGFNQKINRVQCQDLLERGEIQKILKEEKVAPGDVFYIQAGTVHTVYPGILLAEIQQTSDLTYRMYDWNRKDSKGNSRELNTELALDAINYNSEGLSKINYSPEKNKNIPLVRSEHFTTGIITFDKELWKDYTFIDSFIIYLCTEGEFIIISKNKTETMVKKGDVILIPSILKEIKLRPQTRSTLLEVYIDQQKNNL